MPKRSRASTSERLGASQIATANMPRRASAKCGPALLVEVDEHLGVGVRGEPVARGLELLPELAVVVDLAVLDDVDRAVLVRDRLVAALEVDDRQPSRREAGDRVEKDAATVRPAVHERLVHRLENVPVDAVAARRFRRFHT